MTACCLNSQVRCHTRHQQRNGSEHHAADKSPAHANAMHVTQRQRRPSTTARRRHRQNVASWHSLLPISFDFRHRHYDPFHKDKYRIVKATKNVLQALQLDFNAPDFNRYPCLKLAYEALRVGNSAPAVFNAANEVAVERFLASKITFLDIPRTIEHTLTSIRLTDHISSLDALLELDTQAREIASNACEH